MYVSENREVKGFYVAKASSGLHSVCEHALEPERIDRVETLPALLLESSARTSRPRSDHDDAAFRLVSAFPQLDSHV